MRLIKYFMLAVFSLFLGLSLVIFTSNAIAAPSVPKVSGLTPTNYTRPTWTWTSGGGGNGTYRYHLDSEAWVNTKKKTYTPTTALPEGTHTLYVQERDNVGNWSASGVKKIVIDLSMPETEEAIRNFYVTMKNIIESHNKKGFIGLFALTYMHNGEDLSSLFEEPPDLSNIETFSFTIRKIIIAGNTAKVYGAVKITFNDGSPNISWAEPDMINDSDGIGWIKKTINGWKINGNQVSTEAYFNTGHNNTPGDDHYFLRARTISPQAIKSVIFKGPNIPDTPLLPDSRYGGYKAFVIPSLLPPVGTKYSFTINFKDGTQQILYDIVRAYVPTGPKVTVTPGNGTATVHWTDVSASVPNATEYWVVITGNGVYWQSDDLPLTRTSAVFNENGTAEGVLKSGQSYAASVTIFNENGDYAYQIRSFTMP